jgi:hypothetical protein
MAGEKTAEELAAEAKALENKGITDDDAQKLKSWLGRVEKTGKDNSDAMTALTESFNEKFQNITDLLQSQSTPKAEPNAVNEALREKLLGDNPMEGLEFYDKIKTDAQTNLNAMKERKLNAAFDVVKDHPRMSEDVKAEAKKMVSNGIDPNSAVQMAVLKAENKHDKGILSQIKEKNPTVLEMLEPGNPKAGVKPESKLPPNFEAACQRDIAAGTFKDRDEYIKFLDPKIRDSLGLDEK